VRLRLALRALDEWLAAPLILSSVLLPRDDDLHAAARRAHTLLRTRQANV